MATDNFDRANNADLGTNWDVQTGLSSWKIATNAAEPSSHGADCAENWNADTFPNDQYSQGKVTVAGTGGQTGIGVAVRMATAAKTCYLAVVNKAASNNVEIAKWVAGTYTQLGQRTTTWVDGDVLRLEIAGTTLKVYKNGSQLGADLTDSSITSGRVGLINNSTLTSGFVDDWEGGSAADTTLAAALTATAAVAADLSVVGGAAPSVADITETTNSTSATNYNISMPATVNAGDLLLAFVNAGQPTDPGPLTAPSGWTKIGQGQSNANYCLLVIAKSAVGNEDGTTINVDFINAATSCAAQVYRITSWYSTGTMADAVEMVIINQISATPDPPSLDPANWTTEATLWFAGVGGFDHAVGGLPTNYANSLKTVALNNSAIVTCRRTATVGTEDPSTFSYSTGGNNLFVLTLGVRGTAVAANRRAISSFAELETPPPPGFPTVQSLTTTAFDTVNTSHLVAMPAVVNLSDLLLMIFSVDCENGNNDTVITRPVNWTPMTSTAISGVQRTATYLKEADGTEGGTTVNVVTDFAMTAVAQVYRITGWNDSGILTNDIEASTTAVASTSTPELPPLDPVNWATEKTLWITFASRRVDHNISSYSANYTDGTQTKTTSLGANLGSARRENEIGSEDPGIYTYTGSAQSIVGTIGIRPTTGGAAPPRRAQSSWAEMESPAAPGRQARGFWLELEVPDLARRARVPWIEMETPTNDRRALAYWNELQVPDLLKRAQVSYSELETPSLTVPPGELFTILVEQDIAMEISLVNDIDTSWNVDGAAYWYNLAQRNVVDEVRKKITSVRVGSVEYTKANSLQQCKATDNTFWPNVAQNRIYVNTPSSVGNPNTQIVLARFKMYWSNYSVDYGGEHYESRILLQPEDVNVRLSIDGQPYETSIISGGQLELANGDSLIDTLLESYVIIGQAMEQSKLSTGVKEVLRTGIIGEIERTDAAVIEKLWN